jgi:DNA-binding transcriptional ArsR family regulator
MAYEPREGTNAALILAHFRANPEQQLNTHQVVETFGISVGSVAPTIKPLVAAGLVDRDRMGRQFVYSLAAEDTAAGGEDEPFMVALDTDGELFMRGVQLVDGGILLSRPKAQKLRDYLVHTGAWLEQLPPPAEA